jgi:hypothetical protein
MRQRRLARGLIVAACLLGCDDGRATTLPATPGPATPSPAATHTPTRIPAVTEAPEAVTLEPVLRPTPPDSFYEVQDGEFAGPPGSLIRFLELSPPGGARAWAILYRSTGRDGSSVPVSGIVLAPEPPGGTGTGPTPGPSRDGYPVIAWAHGTTGLADSCAPSRDGAVGGGFQPLVELVRTGFVVTATDYEGLGTRGIHPYLVGVSEGRSILDSIRAVQALPEARAGRRAAVLGISQGGHAALWAGELVDGYAPELDIAGIVAASPPIDLRAVQRTVLGRVDAGEAAWLESLIVAAAWRSVYDTPLEGLLTDEAMSIAGALEDECPGSIAGPTRSPFRVDPGSVPEWQTLLEANSPGHRASRPAILVLAATDDVLIPRTTIPVGVERLCNAGSSVELRWVDGPHEATLADPVGAAWALSWLVERFDGGPVVDGCT